MKPRISQIISTDLFALVLSIVIPLVWAVYLIKSFTRPIDDHGPLLKIWGTATAIGAAVLWWRIRRVLWLFTFGSSVEGNVVSIHMTSKKGRIDYTFQLEGKTISSWAAVQPTKKVLALQEGQKVTVLFNPDKPGHSTVRDFYD